MKWVVHIGTQKTGSKSIQQFLSKYSSPSQGYKLHYPKSGRIGVWHRPIHEELIAGKTEKIKMAVKESIESSADLGIISYEDLYRLSIPQINSLYQVLGSAKIILFIRRQDQLVNSRYNQQIKAHRVDFDSIKELESKLTDYNPRFDHMLTINRWSEVFGIENVVPIIYDKHSSSVEKLLDHIGFSDAFVKNNAYAKNPNPALNFESLKILRLVKQLNIDKKDLPHLVTVAHHILQDHFVDTYTNGDQYLLSFSQREKIYQHYQDSNAAVKRNYFFDNDTLFPSLEPHEANTADISVDMKVVQMIFQTAGIAIPEAAITRCLHSDLRWL